MTTELCYTDRCLDRRDTGRFAFNAATQHNNHCGQSAPYQVDSRPAVCLSNCGKPCRGRFVMSSEDDKKRKHREADRRYRESNREKVLERNRRYYEANREKETERFRRYREAHREEETERLRLWREANREKMGELVRRWRKAHPEKTAKAARRWRQSHPEEVSAHKRLRRARIAGGGGSHTEAQWQALKSYYMDQCLCCGDVPDKLTRDHVVPIARGGSDDISNIQPLCFRCNRRKHAKTIDYRIDIYLKGPNGKAKTTH